MKLGATGEYPSGKLNEADEGELIVAVAADKSSGKILLQFGKPVAWLGMDAAQARIIGEMLMKKSEELQPTISQSEWKKAWDHFKEVRQRYQELVSEPGANTSIALQYLFKPMAIRYFSGERTTQLYEAMLNLE